MELATTSGRELCEAATKRPMLLIMAEKHVIMNKNKTRKEDPTMADEKFDPTKMPPFDPSKMPKNPGRGPAIPSGVDIKK